MNLGASIFLCWVAVFGVFASVQLYRVVALKRKGETWTEALTNKNKLMTGNVWLDALLLLALLLGILWLGFER